MRHTIIASKESDTSTVLVLVDTCLTHESHETIARLAPAVVALLERGIPFHAWYDDDANALMLKVV